MLKFFGAASIDSPEGPITGRAVQGRRLALLAALALARGRPVTRDKLIALLWPEIPTDRARHQLSDTVYIVRSALGEDVVRSIGDELLLNLDAITSDVASFERLLDEGQFEAAVELFVGPLLDGFHLSDSSELEHWLDAERARLGQRFAAALESLAEASEARNEFGAAARWWRRLSEHDPYTGRVALRLMRSLEAAGDRAAALKHARAHASLMREEFDTGPDPEVLAFAERIRLEPPVRSAPEPAVVSARHAPSPIEFPATASGQPARMLRRKTLRYGTAAAALLGVLVFGMYGIPRVRPAAARTARSLAVLPFVNMSADPANTYFSDGLSEQIIAALSRIDGLSVAARTSSFALRDSKLDVRAVGDTLGVDAVLEGSVRRDGKRLRVTAQLIDASTGYHIWSDEYDRQLEDIFAVQSEIARAISSALELRLPRANAGSHRTPGIEAYDLYLRGLYLRNDLTADALKQATELFDQAIALEPNFALAYAAKASVIAPRIYFRQLPYDQGLSEMRAVVARALELDAGLGEAHAALGIIRLFFDWDWQGAEQSLQQAIKLNPSDPHAYHMLANYWRVVERPVEAVATRARAVELDPLNARTGILLGNDYVTAGDFDRALTQYSRAIRLDPVNPLALGLGPSLPGGPSLVYLKQRRYREAVEEYIKIATLRGASVREIESLHSAFTQSGMPAFWRRWLELDLRQSGPSPDPLRIAVIWAMTGDTAEALRWLDRAYEEHNPGLIYLRSDLALAGLVSHPRVVRILNEMKFPSQ
jgi:serine/threonine-protein kinase